MRRKERTQSGYYLVPVLYRQEEYLIGEIWNWWLKSRNWFSLISLDLSSRMKFEVLYFKSFYVEIIFSMYWRSSIFLAGSTAPHTFIHDKERSENMDIGLLMTADYDASVAFSVKVLVVHYFHYCEDHRWDRMRMSLEKGVDHTACAATRPRATCGRKTLHLGTLSTIGACVPYLASRGASRPC